MRLGALLVIALAAIVAGAVIGATTNAVNGFVSPTYFIYVMGWDVHYVWLESVTQGIFEGGIVGLFLSVFLTGTIAIISRATCTIRIGLRWLGRIMVAVYASWTLGGICGVAWAVINPASFRSSFSAPSDHIQLLRFAWVGGSIWGAEPGGLLVVVVATLIWFAIRWPREVERESRG